ncbi:hypothetical protein [Streptomyces sp. NPDC059761]
MPFATPPGLNGVALRLDVRARGGVPLTARTLTKGVSLLGIRAPERL